MSSHFDIGPRRQEYQNRWTKRIREFYIKPACGSFRGKRCACTCLDWLLSRGRRVHYKRQSHTWILVLVSASQTRPASLGQGRLRPRNRARGPTTRPAPRPAGALPPVSCSWDWGPWELSILSTVKQLETSWAFTRPQRAGRGGEGRGALQSPPTGGWRKPCSQSRVSDPPFPPALARGPPFRFPFVCILT